MSAFRKIFDSVKASEAALSTESAPTSVGNAPTSVGNAPSSVGTANASAGNANASAGNANASAGNANASAGNANASVGIDIASAGTVAQDIPTESFWGRNRSENLKSYLASKGPTLEQVIKEELGQEATPPPREMWNIYPGKTQVKPILHKNGFGNLVDKDTNFVFKRIHKRPAPLNPIGYQNEETGEIEFFTGEQVITCRKYNWSIGARGIVKNLNSYTVEVTVTRCDKDYTGDFLETEGFEGYVPLGKLEKFKDVYAMKRTYILQPYVEIVEKDLKTFNEKLVHKLSQGYIEPGRMIQIGEKYIVSLKHYNVLSYLIEQSKTIL
jgi:hypothetical protein